MLFIFKNTRSSTQSIVSLQGTVKIRDGISSKRTLRHPPTRKYLPPEQGDEVVVRYSLTLAGQQLQSTGGDSIAFTIGAAASQGPPLRVLQTLVRQLYQGEDAEFTIELGMLEDLSLDGWAPNTQTQLQLELVKCPLREDLFGDQGAIKRIIKSSEGRHPKDGDECQVSYKITEKGAAGPPLSVEEGVYKIGGMAPQLGQLAQVFDKALLSMKLKEEVVVTCRPNGPFGPKAGQSLEISLTLEEIFQVHDVSLGKYDGAVLRKRLKEGAGPHRLHDTGRVRVRVLTVTSNRDKVSGRPFEVSFVAGDGEVCDAMEGAVLGLQEGDELMLRVMEPACCEGLIEIETPLEAPVMVHFTVLEVQQVPEKWDLAPPERLERAVARRHLAGRLFQAQRLRLAAKHYQEIASFLARPEDFKEQRAEALELRRVAFLNEAACMLQLGEMSHVKDLCDKVLKEEPEQPKALFRRAKALLALKEHQAAVEDLQRLKEVDPSNVAGQRLLREAKEELRKQDRVSSKTYSKMCAGLGDFPEDLRAPKTSPNSLVEAPDLEEEYAKLSRETGVPLHRLKPVK